MTAVLPALAAASLPNSTGVLVSCHAGRVLHVAHGRSSCDSPRRRIRPVCNQYGTRWPTATIDGRPLCARCRRVLAPLLGASPHQLASRLTVEQLEACLTTARDLATCSAAVLAVLHGPAGATARLSRAVRDTRARLTPSGSGLTHAERIATPRPRPVSRFPMRAGR